MKGANWLWYAWFSFFSPELKKIRSKPELVREVGPEYDLSCFDFRSGKINQSAIRKSKRLKGTTYDYARGDYCYYNETCSGLILGLRQADERRRYKVTLSLIGWAQT